MDLRKKQLNATTLQETLEVKPEEFGEVSDIIKRHDCDKKDEAILQGVMPAKNLHRGSREPWKYFMTLDEIMEVYPNL